MSTNRLLKNCAANAAHGNAVLAVGLRAETLLQRFLLATTASSVFQQPANLSDNQCPSVVKNPIRNIRVNSRPFAVKNIRGSNVWISLRPLRPSCKNSDPYPCLPRRSPFDKLRAKAGPFPASWLPGFLIKMLPSVSSVTSVFKIRIRAIRGKNLTGRCFGHERTQSTQRGFLYDLCDPLWLKNPIRIRVIRGKKSVVPTKVPSTR